MKIQSIAMYALAAIATITGQSEARLGEGRRLGVVNAWNAGWARHYAAGGPTPGQMGQAYQYGRAISSGMGGADMMEEEAGTFSPGGPAPIPSWMGDEEVGTILYPRSRCREIGQPRTWTIGGPAPTSPCPLPPWVRGRAISSGMGGADMTEEEAGTFSPGGPAPIPSWMGDEEAVTFDDFEAIGSYENGGSMQEWNNRNRL